jgi:hypothetical protein
MKAIAGATLLVTTGLLTSAACTADEVLTLACQGKTQYLGPTLQPDKLMPDEPLSMGLILNFTARTVTGFKYPTYLADVPVAITAVNEVTVTFAGSKKEHDNKETSLTGTVDRITGDLQADYLLSSSLTMTYSLKCKPTQRMF